MVGAAGDITGAESEPITLSALQHAAFCLRQAALIHLEQLWEDNLFTAEGNVLHAVVDKGGTRKIAGVRRVSAMPLFSNHFNLTGKADLVEFIKQADGSEVVLPIEYKRGKPKLHRADEVQLCAQALCLEEMLGQRVEEGVLFYWQIKRRQKVPIDSALRQLTEKIIADFTSVMTSGKTPPPLDDKRRCRSCSLVALCKPDIVLRPVKNWRSRIVRQIVSEEPS
ncbi:MAG: CRISPR-associated protein Cas4 [Candidatus Tokpelaia hoelldobleri]|uniref:CRISPR-associated exonuclease Cas4 n=1 Tax=Candidatus Tokpelaia hoelldobleri TaxID=1902579 RepID=A0A1U9JTV3_9HYPH|nr:MAG: CRISPR-associated protein Cas4 [Candidatus Tokpelaia hoelldoblerii]